MRVSCGEQDAYRRGLRERSIDRSAANPNELPASPLQLEVDFRIPLLVSSRTGRRVVLRERQGDDDPEDRMTSKRGEKSSWRLTNDRRRSTGR